eukprot:gene3777-4036_t
MIETATRLLTRGCLYADDTPVGEPGSENGSLRDPVAFRVISDPHYRTGERYKVYPTYDFACPYLDLAEGVTHALRTLEFRDRDQLYNLVQHGPDDPRLPTLRGLMRGGCQPEALKAFLLEQALVEGDELVLLAWGSVTVTSEACGDSLPDPLFQLHGLKQLELADCSGLTSLPSAIGNLQQLTWLDLRGCESLAKLPESIGQLSRLQDLGLARCRGLASLPAEIGNLQQLTRLKLGGCGSLAKLPESIGQLSGLQDLSLAECSGLTSLHSDIGNLQQLTRLNLRQCQLLPKLPESIGRLCVLQHLNLSWCSGLTSLPSEIGDLQQLTWLNLGGCESLAKLPESIGRLCGLQDLGLARCFGMKSLPSEIGNLQQLTELDLRRCQSLAKLPESIVQLSRLQVLGLAECSGLTSLPPEIGDLQQLTQLNLKGCESLAKLPESIRRLSVLQHLDLAWCSGLTSLPSEIVDLQQLTGLNLCRCKLLAQLPESIGRLSRLRYLSLGYCKALPDLPQSSRDLHLDYLDLVGTRLQELYADQDMEAGRFWWLLLSTWLLLFLAVVCGFAAFTASAVAMFENWKWLAVLLLPGSVLLALGGVLMVKRLFSDIFPGWGVVWKGFSLPCSCGSRALQPPRPEDVEMGQLVMSDGFWCKAAAAMKEAFSSGPAYQQLATSASGPILQDVIEATDSTASSDGYGRRIIPLPGTTKEQWMQIVPFLYPPAAMADLPEAAVTWDNLEAVLVLGDKYDMKGLVNKGRDFVRNNARSMSSDERSNQCMCSQ